jgi:hypothetical protein
MTSREGGEVEEEDEERERGMNGSTNEGDEGKGAWKRNGVVEEMRCCVASSSERESAQEGEQVSQSGGTDSDAIPVMHR